MTYEQQYETLIQEIISQDIDNINACLEHNPSYIDNNFVSKVEETAKGYKKDCPEQWAKLNMVLAAVHLYHSKNVSYANKKINVREKGVKYHNQAFNFYEKEKCDRALAVCHEYLDTAYEQFVYNLKQYAGIVPEDESVIRVIEKYKIAAAYPSLKEEYTPSDVVVEVIATATNYAYYKKPTLREERKKWRTAYQHLYRIIEALELHNNKHPRFNSTLGEALSRNKLIRLTPQENYSIGSSLRSFLYKIGRISYLYDDNYKQEKREKKYNQGKPIARLDSPTFKDNSNTKLIDKIEHKESMFRQGQFKELMPWEDVIDLDLIAHNKHLAHQIKKYIETDPEGRLKKCCSKKFPQANCQAFAIRMMIQQPKATLPKLAEEWQIPKGTLLDSEKGKIRDRFHRLLQAIAIEEEIKYNLSPQLGDYIRQDKSNKLKDCYPGKHTKCNAHSLALHRLLSDSPIRFEVLAQQWKISEKIVNKHWQEACLPLLQEIINSQEYL